MPAKALSAGRKAAARRPGLEVVSRPGTSALYLRGTVRGQRVFESTGTDNPALAEEARAAKEAEMYRAAVLGVRPTVTFSAAVLAYLKHEDRPASTLAAVNKLLTHFGSKVTCDKIDQAAMDRAVAAICPGAKPQSALRQVGTPAKAILNYAARRGWCPPPKFEAVKGSPRRTDWLTPAEAEALIAGASGTIRPLLTFLLCTGGRMGEAIELEWRDVNLPHARATFRDTKNGYDRIVDLPPRAIAALDALPHRLGRVFRRQDGQPYRSTNTVRGAEGGQIDRAFAAALKAAGIDRHLTPHHLRHTWATWSYALDRDLVRLQQDGGWRTITMVARYTKLAPAGLLPEIQAFWGLPVTVATRHERKAG
jgi:integrase